MVGTRFQSTTGRVAVLAVLLALASLPLRAAPKPGGLDKSFGGDGRVLTELPGPSVGKDAFLMRDGRILVVGEKGSGQTLLLRYRPNGKLDKSFSGNGWFATNALGDPQRPKILVGRNGIIFVVASSNDDFVVMKLGPRGNLKTNFGTGGVLVIDFGGNESVRGVAPAPQGKFYAFGYSTSDTAIARFNADGMLDTNSDSDPIEHWDEDGMVVVAGGDLAIGLEELQNGKVVVGSSRGAYDIFMSRFTAEGEPDNTFHGTGEVELSLGEGISHIEKATFAPGVMYVGANVGGGERNVRVGRYKLGGTPDMSFDEDGRKTYDLGGDEDVTTVVEAADGKPVLVGATSRQDSAVDKWFVLRLKRNGTRDRSFGEAGAAFARFHPGANVEDSFAEDVDIQADGRILASGRSFTNDDTDSDSTLARFLSGACGTIGTQGGDALRGLPARDFMCGRKGGDMIRGLGGKDRLLGGPGPDLLNGGAGFDVCIGGRGNDLLRDCET